MTLRLFFWLGLFCISFSCANEHDPLMNGWSCKTVNECGNAKEYKCAQKICRLVCKNDTECPGQEHCKSGLCLKDCEENETRPCYKGKGCTPKKNGSFKCEGSCLAGLQSCLNHQWSKCEGQIQPKSESCNNVDDDCDGTVDQNLSQQCESSCEKSQATCVQGSWICKARQPSKEICDNIDNDCNGKIDENIFRDCYSGESKTLDKGHCKKGHQTCFSGKWSLCEEESIPQIELCDQIDNDCDGKVDNNCFWNFTAGGTGAWLKVNHHTTDPNGNSYITGSFNGRVRLGSDLLQSPNGFNAFIAKISSKGKVLWTKQIKSAQKEHNQTILLSTGSKLHLTKDGSLYFIGYFTGTVTFPNAIRKSNTNGYSGFVSKLSDKGRFLWINMTQGKGIPASIENKSLVSNKKNLFVLSTFQNMKQKGKPLHKGLLLTKYAFEGTEISFQKINLDTKWIKTTHLFIDVQGQFYLSGYFDKEVSFGTTKTKSLEPSLFIAKLNTKQELLWFKSFPGALLSNNRKEYHVLTVDSEENIYITGMYNQTAHFDAFVLKQAKAPQNKTSSYLAQLNSKGVVIWAFRLEGQNVQTSSIHLSENKNLLLLGKLEQPQKSPSVQNLFIKTIDRLGRHIHSEQLCQGSHLEVATAHISKNENILYLSGIFQNKMTLKFFQPASIGQQDLFLTKLSFKQPISP